jgi:hypothetical protein
MILFLIIDNESMAQKTIKILNQERAVLVESFICFGLVEAQNMYKVNLIRVSSIQIQVIIIHFL